MLIPIHNTNVYTHTYTYTYTYIHIHLHINLHIYIHTYIHIHTNIHPHTHTNVHINTQKHTFIFTYIQMVDIFFKLHTVVRGKTDPTNIHIIKPHLKRRQIWIKLIIKYIWWRNPFFLWTELPRTNSTFVNTDSEYTQNVRENYSFIYIYIDGQNNNFLTKIRIITINAFLEQPWIHFIIILINDTLTKDEYKLCSILISQTWKWIKKLNNHNRLYVKHAHMYT